MSSFLESAENILTAGIGAWADTERAKTGAPVSALEAENDALRDALRIQAETQQRTTPTTVAGQANPAPLDWRTVANYGGLALLGLVGLRMVWRSV